MNLTDMTVPQLRSLAASFGVTGRSTLKKAELIAALSAPEIAELVALSVTVAEMSAADVADAATKEHEDEEIDLTSTINDMISGWTPEAGTVSDHNPDTEGRPAAFDVVGGSVAALLDQDAPNRIRFNTPPVKQSSREMYPKGIPEVKVGFLRTEPGAAMASLTSMQGLVRNATVRRHGRTLVLWDESLSFPIKARTFNRLAKQWARENGVRVDIINVVREF